MKKIPKIESLRVGKVKKIGNAKSKESMNFEIESAYIKHSKDGKIFLTKNGLVGDEQSDKIHHGGFDKACLAYSLENYDLWKKEVKIDDFCKPGGLGENITVSNLNEKNVCIGDIFTVGSAKIQVSQPRQPCWKISRIWKARDLSLKVEKTGRTGWYYRVLKEGFIQKGDEIVLICRKFPKLTIKNVSDILHDSSLPKKKIENLINCSDLTENMRIGLKKRLDNNLYPNQDGRLYGPLKLKD